MRASPAGGGLSVAVVLAAVLAGCGGGVPGSAGSSRPAAPSPVKLSPAITPAAARAVVAGYVRGNNDANAHLDGQLEATVETGPQLVIDQASYVIQKRVGHPFPPFTYRDLVFYIPALPATARRWFAADAVASSGGRQAHEILMFVRDRPATWKLASAIPSSGASLPVAVGPAGTAAPVLPGDHGLAITPAQLPARHAQLLSGQPAVSTFAPGRWTSITARSIDLVKRVYYRAGWTFQDRWNPDRYPVYALRTTDGGAVVWYFLRDRQTGVRRHSARPLLAGSAIRALAGHRYIGHKFTIDSVSGFIAVIPPAGKGKITIKAGVTRNIGATVR